MLSNILSRTSSPAPPDANTDKKAADVDAKHVVVDEDGCCFLDEEIAPASRPQSRPASPAFVLAHDIGRDNEVKEESRRRQSVIVLDDDEEGRKIKKSVDKARHDAEKAKHDAEKEKEKEEKEREKKRKDAEREKEREEKEAEKEKKDHEKAKEREEKEREKKRKDAEKEKEKEEKEAEKERKRREETHSDDEKHPELRRHSNPAPEVDTGSDGDLKRSKSKRSKLPWKKEHKHKGEHHEAQTKRKPSAPELDDAGYDSDDKKKRGSKLPWSKGRNKDKSEDSKRDREKQLRDAEKEREKALKDAEKEQKKYNKEWEKEEKEMAKNKEKESKDVEKEQKEYNKELDEEQKEMEKNEERLEKNIEKEKKRQEKEMTPEQEKYVREMQEGERKSKEGKQIDFFADKSELTKDGIALQHPHHRLGPIRLPHLSGHKREHSKDSGKSKDLKEYKKKSKKDKKDKGKRKNRGFKDTNSSEDDPFKPEYSKPGKSDPEVNDRSYYDNEGFYVGVVDSKPSESVGANPAGKNWYKKGTPPPKGVGIPETTEYRHSGDDDKYGHKAGNGSPDAVHIANPHSPGPVVKPTTGEEQKSRFNFFRRKGSPERKSAKERLASETADESDNSSDSDTTEGSKDGRGSNDSIRSLVPDHEAPENIPLPHSTTSLIPHRKSGDGYHVPDALTGERPVQLPIIAENPYPNGLQVPSRKLFSDGFHFPPGLELYGITKKDWEEMVHTLNCHINPHRTWWRTAIILSLAWPFGVVSTSLFIPGAIAGVVRLLTP